MRDAPQNECTIMKADDGCVGCVETAKHTHTHTHTHTKREDEGKKGVVGHSDFLTNFVVLFLNNENFLSLVQIPLIFAKLFGKKSQKF
jgi:hypothetical protein